MKIYSRFDSTKVVYESEKETVKEAVVEAVSKDADLRGADLRGADFYQVKFSGKGGNTKITKSQVEAFHAALGIVVEDDKK